MSTPRRTFLASLLASPFLGLLLRGAARAAQRLEPYLLNVFSVAGFQYYDGPGVLPRLRPGEPLALCAEPRNPHDEFAVEIFCGGEKLGYVPRSDNRHLSRLLRQGAALTCRVVEVDPGGAPWNAVRVEVRLSR